MNRKLVVGCVALVIALVAAVVISASRDGGGVATPATAAGASAPAASTTIPQPTQAEMAAAGLEELPVAAESDRVDVAAPTFSNPTDITNPLFPVSEVHSSIFSGVVDEQPFHTETTLLPETRFIEWAGRVIETRVLQYFAFIDGRIEEVALDYYAQADDGSVWYFGEDVFDYDDEGFNDSTEGTWLTPKDGPPAMIMPGDPKVGDVHRAENIPSLAFEEVEITSVTDTVDGPAGPVEGALVGRELHDDGSYSDKIFAPGYGEFYTEHRGEIEAMALAVPTDAVDGPPPTELLAVSAGAGDVIEAVRSHDWRAGSDGIDAAAAAWETYRSQSVPPRLEAEMTTALEAVAEAVDAQAADEAGMAAIDVAQSALDFTLRYQVPAEIDLARFELWAHQVLVDAAAEDMGGVRGDVTTMEWVRDRFAHTLERVDLIAINGHLVELRNTVNDDDLGAAAAEADALLHTLAEVEPTDS